MIDPLTLAAIVGGAVKVIEVGVSFFSQDQERKLRREIFDKNSENLINLQEKQFEHDKELQSNLFQQNKELQSNLFQHQDYQLLQSEEFQKQMLLLQEGFQIANFGLNWIKDIQQSRQALKNAKELEEIRHKNTMVREDIRQKWEAQRQENQFKFEKELFAKRSEFEREIKIYDRESQILLISYQHYLKEKTEDYKIILNDHPLSISGKVLSRNHEKHVLGSLNSPLPPIVILDTSKLDDLQNNFKVESDFSFELSEFIRSFLCKNYDISDPVRPVKFLGSVWKGTPAPSLEAGSENLFFTHNHIPTIILSPYVNGNNIVLQVAWWDAKSSTCHLTSAGSIPWRMILHEAARKDVLKWKETREQISQMVEAKELLNLGGIDEYNLKVFEREQACLEYSRDIDHFYSVSSRRFFELLVESVGMHCNLVLSFIIDRYYLSNYITPPNFLHIFGKFIGNDFIGDKEKFEESIYKSYVNSYNSLKKEDPENEGEFLVESSHFLFALELSKSLANLPDLSFSQQMMNKSIEDWLSIKKVCAVIYDHENAWKHIKKNAVFPDDHEFLVKLREILVIIEPSSKFVANIDCLIKEWIDKVFSLNSDSSELTKRITDVW